MKQPWMKWYPADWRSDPRLRSCSLAARGLWADMIGIMHEAEPYGSLLVNGAPVNEKQLASLVGASAREVRVCLGELEAAGVYSIENGIVFSRRMLRDFEKAERDKANGKGGGNPTLKGGVNPPDKGEDKAQKLEARKKEDAAIAAPPDPERQLFERGKEVAGKDAGGLIAKLLKAKKGNVALARAVIEQASTKQNAREYIGAACVGGHASESGKRLTNDEQYWGEGRIPGIV